MSCKKIVVGGVAALVLVTAGFGFGYQAKTEESRLRSLQQQLVKEQASIVEQLKRLHTSGEAGPLDIFPEEIAYLRASLDVSATDADARKILAKIESVCDQWEQTAQEGFKRAALGALAQMQIKAKILTIKIDNEQRRLKLSGQ